MTERGKRTKVASKPVTVWVACHAGTGTPCEVGLNKTTIEARMCLGAKPRRFVAIDSLPPMIRKEIRRVYK